MNQYILACQSMFIILVGVAQANAQGTKLPVPCRTGESILKVEFDRGSVLHLLCGEVTAKHESVKEPVEGLAYWLQLYEAGSRTSETVWRTVRFKNKWKPRDFRIAKRDEYRLEIAYIDLYRLHYYEIDLRALVARPKSWKEPVELTNEPVDKKHPARGHPGLEALLKTAHKGARLQQQFSLESAHFVDGAIQLCLKLTYRHKGKTDPYSANFVANRDDKTKEWTLREVGRPLPELDITKLPPGCKAPGGLGQTR